MDSSVHWAGARQNQKNYLYTQRRLESAWTFTQSDQILCCQHEENLVRSNPLHPQRRLIRLCGCPGWSESLLDAQVIFSVLSCASWNVLYNCSSELFYLALYISPLWVWAWLGHMWDKPSSACGWSGVFFLDDLFSPHLAIDSAQN